MRLEEAVDHRRAALTRQIEGQTLRAEALADLTQHLFGARIATIDLVDDDERTEATLVCEVHEPFGHCVHASRSANHDTNGLNRLQHGQRAAEEVWEAGSVDQREVGGAGVEAADGGVYR